MAYDTLDAAEAAYRQSHPVVTDPTGYGSIPTDGVVPVPTPESDTGADFSHYAIGIHPNPRARNKTTMRNSMDHASIPKVNPGGHDQTNSLGTYNALTGTYQRPANYYAYGQPGVNDMGTSSQTTKAQNLGQLPQQLTPAQSNVFEQAAARQNAQEKGALAAGSTLGPGADTALAKSYAQSMNQQNATNPNAAKGYAIAGGIQAIGDTIQKAFQAQADSAKTAAANIAKIPGPTDEFNNKYRYATNVPTLQQSQVS